MITYFDRDLIATLLTQAGIEYAISEYSKLIICQNTDIPSVQIALPTLYLPFVQERQLFGKIQIIVNLEDHLLWRWIPDPRPIAIIDLGDISDLALSYARKYGYAWGNSPISEDYIILYGSRIEASRVAYAIKETIVDPEMILIDNHPIMPGRVRIYFNRVKASVERRDAWMIKKSKEIGGKGA